MQPVTVYCRAPEGLDAPVVSVEVYLARGLPSLSIVGLVETAVKESRDRVRAAIQNSGFSMPDQRITLKKMIAEGEYVAALATYSGTQTGPMGDFPITGNFAEVHYLSMFRIEDGKVAELWVEWDNLAIFTQLGLFPPPAPGTKP